MRFILDADGIIKLNRAGVLGVVIQARECVVTWMVYEEVVVAGREAGYADAELIDRILSDGARILDPAKDMPQRRGLGVGELSILAILEAGEGVVVTDDQQFISMLSRTGTLALSPAEVIVLLVREGKLDFDEALAALDRIESAVSDDSYLDAKLEIRRLMEEQP